MTFDKDSWCTPGWLCDLLPEVDLDPCSNPKSKVRAKRKLSLEDGDDGLADLWESANTVFCNPPYSRGSVQRWVAKSVGFVGMRCARRVLLLVKLDPTTRWWKTSHETPGVACDTYLFRRRIRFEGARSGAKFACALLVLRHPNEPYSLHEPLAAELWPSLSR